MNQHFEEQLIPQEGMLYRIMTENELLMRSNCKSSIDRVIRLVYESLEAVQHADDTPGMGERFFEICYLELIYDYAKFVQTLPEPGVSDEVPMLERGLARAAATLQWFQPHLEGMAKQNPALGGLQKLVYVVFSSALLYELGAVEQERMIHLCNAQGHFISRWDPLMGYMEAATHYKIRYRTGWHDSLKEPLTHCLAKQLMPSIGLLWLSDSQDSLRLWFSLLTDCSEAWLEYGLSFAHADIESVMQEHLKTIDAIDKKVPDDTLLGEIFWDWLKHALSSGSLRVNEHGSDVHVLSDGLLLDVDLLFDKFSKYLSTDINKITVFQQFNHMGLIRISGEDFQLGKYFSEYSTSGNALHGSVNNLFGSQAAAQNVKRRMIQGILIDQAHALIALKQFGTVSSVNNVSPVSWLASFMNRFKQNALVSSNNNNMSL